ncbi:hypothetical protein BOX15_Mlig012016g3, partial [Macrostomum lignano]
PTEPDRHQIMKGGSRGIKRQKAKTVKDGSSLAAAAPVTTDVVIDTNALFSAKEKFDASNALALPGMRRRKRRPTDDQSDDDDDDDNGEDDEESKKRRKRLKLKRLKRELQSDLLTKKKRKELERIVRKKESAKTRSQLWEELRQYQFPREEGEATATAHLLPSAAIHGVVSKRAKPSDKKKSPGDNTEPDANTDASIKPLLKGWQQQKQQLVKDSDSSTDTSDITVSSSESESELEHDDAPASASITVDAQTNDESKATAEAEAETAIKEHRPATFVQVRRSKAVQQRRLELPILSEEHSIMEAVSGNDVVLICGQTGSGKTTQVPQFLYEAGYALDGRRVVVTEPRRVAAIAMSERVGQELGLGRNRVAYQIRYQGNVTEDTVIKFVTDGVLLKELESDVLLRNYSAVVIDEAHERTIYTDILIGLLSRVVCRRRRLGHPLKLIIMSATLRVQDFLANERLFPSAAKPPLVRIDARQYPVTVHFNRRTEDDYLKAAYAKVCRLHTSLPPGGVLVFVTGAQEVVTLCSWLRRAFRKSKSTTTTSSSTSEAEAEDRRLDICLDNYSAVPADEDAELHEAPIDAELRRDGRLQADDDDDDGNVEVDADVEGFRLTDEIGDEPTKRQVGSSGPVHVVGLYSLMPPERQAAAFREPPNGHRMIVVATNVAETSITIPCVRYVVDTGRVKTKVYDKVTGVSTFVVTWTSKASAEQRAGRAGRLGPGHCYRLYSSQVFTDSFKDFAEPELLTKPVDEVVLLAKLYVNDVLHFPFPNAPDGEAVAASEARLVKLGALDSRKRLTPQGALMRQFPVAARFAKMLVVCEQQEELIPYVILLVACLSVPEIFVEESAASSAGDDNRGNDDSSVERKQRAKAFRRSFARAGQALLLGDPMSLIGVAAWYERQLGQRGRTETELVEQLGQLGVRHRAIGEVRKLRRHLTDIAGRLFVRRQVFLDPALPPPPERVSLQMRRLLASVMPDQVASKIPDKPRVYRCRSLAGDLYIHPSSVLARELPPTVLFQEVHESSKMFMRCVCAIDESWLSTAQDNRV